MVTPVERGGNRGAESGVEDFLIEKCGRYCVIVWKSVPLQANSK